MADPKKHPDFNIRQTGDALIGAQFYNQQLIDDQIKLRNDLPILQNSVFGWITSGVIKGSLWCA